jgi:hypothetical protein
VPFRIFGRQDLGKYRIFAVHRYVGSCLDFTDRENHGRGSNFNKTAKTLFGRSRLTDVIVMDKENGKVPVELHVNRHITSEIYSSLQDKELETVNYFNVSNMFLADNKYSSIAVLLTERSDIAYNNHEHIIYSVRQYIKNKTQFTMHFIQKDKIITKQFAVDMFYTDKARQAMYGLNMDKERNKLELIGYSNGKIRKFLFDAGNLFKDPETDIWGFNAFIYEGNAYLKVFTRKLDFDSENVYVFEYINDKDNVFENMFTNKASGYGEVFTKIGEKGSTQVYRLEGVQDVHCTKINTKRKHGSILMSYYLIYKDSKGITRTRIIPSQITDATPKRVTKHFLTGDHVNSAVYIGKNYSYIYEQYQEKSTNVNVVSVYDKNGNLVKVINPKKYVVFPNLYEYPSRYVYYIDNKAREKDKPRFHILDVDAVEYSKDGLPNMIPELKESVYPLPNFEKAVFENRKAGSALSKRITVNPAMLEKFHISADNDGHFVIYTEEDNVYKYGYQYDTASEDYGHLLLVNYIIDNKTQKKVYSFLNSKGLSKMAVKDVSNIFENNIDMKMEKTENQEVER